MAIRSGLFDSTEITESAGGYPRGNHAETADFFASYFASFIGNGVFPREGGSFTVSPGTGLSVSVGPGKCFINGYYAVSGEEETVALTAGESEKTYRIVLRLNIPQAKISVEKLEDDLTLTRDADIWELGIADVTVGAEAAAVTAAQITDTRLDPDQCGLVANVLGTIDSRAYQTQLTAAIAGAQQLEEALRSFCGSAESSFNSWYSGIREKFGSDAPGYLMENKADRDLGNVPAKGIGNGLLADGAVTAEKLAPGAAVTEKIADRAVTAGKIAPGVIGAAHLSRSVRAGAWDPYSTVTNPA